MVLKIEKFQSPGKGNGLRATSKVSPGDQLYSTVPYTYTICDSSIGKVCEFCLCENAKLLRCASCQYAKYCDVHCQRAAWPDHKKECKCLKFNPPLMYSVRAIGRTIFKFLRELPFQRIFKMLKQLSCPSEELCSLTEQQTNVKKISKQMKASFRHTEQMIRLYLKMEISALSKLPDGLNILTLLCMFLCNSFTIGNIRGNKVAVGLYPSMSLLNHSCDPNCAVIFDGRILLLRAVQEIQAGEELTISYTDTMMPTEVRKLDLKCKYCFDCDCRRCQTKDQDDEMLSGDKVASNETKSVMDKLDDLPFEPHYQDPVSLCQAQLEKNKGCLPDTNIHQLIMLSYLMNALMDRNRWDEALPYGIRTLEPYRIYNPGFVSVRAQQLIKVGKLLCHGGKSNEAREAFNEASLILKVTHGTEHSDTKELMKLLQHCEDIGQKNKTGP